MRKLLVCLVMAVLLAASASAFYIKDQLKVGESRNYTTPAGYDEVRVVTVSELSKEVVLDVNGEYSDSLQKDEEFAFQDGSYVKVTSIIYGKLSYVEFSFSPGRGNPLPSLVGSTWGPANATRNASADACAGDVGCLDDDPCTRDSCAGAPRVCVHTTLPGCSTGSADLRRVPAAEPTDVFARIARWLAGLFRTLFGS